MKTILASCVVALTVSGCAMFDHRTPVAIVGDDDYYTVPVGTSIGDYITTKEGAFVSNWFIDQVMKARVGR